MANPWMILPPAIFGALALLMIQGLGDDDGNQLPSALVGQVAPALPQDSLPGIAPFTADVMADGELKLVNFWASWCGPCRVEHPNLEALAAQGLPIYGVNYKDQPDSAVAFLAELGNPYTGVLADPGGRPALEWGVYGVPETFIVDGSGTILGRMAGPVTTTTMQQRLMPILDSAGVTLHSE